MNEILEKVIKLVEETLDVEDVTAETLMQDDLGIESLEFYELLSNLEMAFRIKIPEKILSNVETVDDIAYEVEKILEKK